LRPQAALVNGKPEASASPRGCHTDACGLPLNDAARRARILHNPATSNLRIEDRSLATSASDH